MPLEREDLGAAPRVPDLRRAGRQLPVTMREPSGLNAAEQTDSGVPLEREDLGAAPRVPDLRRPVATPGDDPRAVGAERRRMDGFGVPLEREDLGAAPRVPDLRRLVAAPGDDARAVGAERRRRRRIRCAPRA